MTAWAISSLIPSKSIVLASPDSILSLSIELRTPGEGGGVRPNFVGVWDRLTFLFGCSVELSEADDLELGILEVVLFGEDR